VCTPPGVSGLAYAHISNALKENIKFTPSVSSPRKRGSTVFKVKHFLSLFCFQGSLPVHQKDGAPSCLRHRRSPVLGEASDGGSERMADRSPSASSAKLEGYAEAPFHGSPDFNMALKITTILRIIAVMASIFSFPLAMMRSAYSRIFELYE